MNLRGNGSPEGAARSNILKRIWGRFNHWRKRYFGIRMLFWLLLLSNVCVWAFYPILPRLVRYAIQYLDAGSEPRLVDAMARHNRIREAHRLQISLRAVVDTNADGSLSPSESDRLRGLGLDPEELQKKSVDASLPHLVEASHSAGLLPKSYTVAAARRNAWFSALAEVEAIKRPLRAEIEGMLKWWEKPDYSRLETWRHGASLFPKVVLSPVGAIGRPRTVFVWLLTCFFVSLMVTALARRGRLAIGLVIGGVLGALVVLCSLVSHFGLYLIVYDVWGICEPLGFLCLTMACTGYAGKISGRGRSGRFYRPVAAIGLAVVLLTWRWFAGQTFEGDELSWEYWPADRLLYLRMPGLVKDLAILVGGACLVAAVLTLMGINGREKRVKRSPSVESPSSNGPPSAEA